MKTQVNNINDLLGNPEKRFFSSGFKKVRHSLKRLHIDPIEQKISAVGAVLYPADWSIKDEPELKPHLSTLDGALLSLHLCCAYLKSIFDLTEYQLSHIWIRKVALKSGSFAQFDLDNLIIVSNWKGVEETEDSLCGNVSRFSCEVGNMKIDIYIDHFVNSMNHIIKKYDTIQDLIGNMDSSFYGEVYRSIAYELTNVNVDKDNLSLSSQITIKYPYSESKFCGIGSVYLPHYTWLDTFVCASQQVQALFYAIDKISRDNSNNLWMREIIYEYKEPIYKPLGFVQTAAVQQAKILKMGNQLWRTALIECSNNSSASFRLVVNIAHELPSSFMECACNLENYKRS
ncbi:AvrD family protein [Paenibacillus sp. BR2-3]|uniref:AvrD family protein n=1 Tax=Paenibacillus sp. BR2-3 TaxID=3048494 RepID=UPI00397751E4